MNSPKRKNRQAECIDGLWRNGLQQDWKSGGGYLPHLSLDIQAYDSNGLSDFPVVYGAYESLYPKFWGLQAPQQKIVVKII